MAASRGHSCERSKERGAGDGNDEAATDAASGRCKSRGARGFGSTLCVAPSDPVGGQAASSVLVQPAKAGPITMIAKTMKSTSKPNLVSSDIAKLRERPGGRSYETPRTAAVL